MEVKPYIDNVLQGNDFLVSEIIIGSESDLKAIENVPELLEIDQEIGKPYINQPLLFNSQAWSRKLELPWAINKIGQPNGLSVLDVGSGASPLPFFLERRGASVVSIDPEIPPDLPNNSISRVRAALPQLPFRNGAFDIVCCISVLEHLQGQADEQYAELIRVARKRLILTFDVALGPLASFGLSMVVLRALSKTLARPFSIPNDSLRPKGIELKSFGPHIGVCLICIDKTEMKYNGFKLTAKQRILRHIHKVVQDSLAIQRRLVKRLIRFLIRRIRNKA